MFPNQIMNLIAGKVALGRIQSYMQVSSRHPVWEQLKGMGTPVCCLCPFCRSLSGTMQSSKQRRSAGLYETLQAWTMDCLVSVQELELEQVPLQPAAAPGAPAILIRNSSFAWEQDGAPLLRHLNLEVTSGQLLIVVGEVGAGGSLSLV